MVMVVIQLTGIFGKLRFKFKFDELAADDAVVVLSYLLVCLPCIMYLRNSYTDHEIAVAGIEYKTLACIPWKNPFKLQQQ
ncbi:hypothetical protein QR98_0075450 [Sarcoptes scabiei]|uniref:Uncharacterized protein n=1 Tax=Sarcoptes scabiei TaxID=52283 RepID=A0A132ADF1_SARSC|nr:hypothetical protein QR98_0075450 [Sarcoptes scabiei]